MRLREMCEFVLAVDDADEWEDDFLVEMANLTVALSARLAAQESGLAEIIEEFTCPSCPTGYEEDDPVVIIARRLLAAAGRPAGEARGSGTEPDALALGIEESWSEARL
jgi:hypothetical protein